MATADAWTQYWQSGQTHSCFVANKPFDTAPSWSTFFDGVVDGGKILDLACGGGSLTRIAASHPAGFAVTGVDYAEALAPVEGAEVRQGVRLESLPFPDASFDGVVSQFGIEYADLQLSLREAVRVLANRGQLGLLIHHADGELASAARQGFERLQPLIAQDGPVAKAIALGQAASRGEARHDLVSPIMKFIEAESKKPQDQTTGWAISFLSEIMQKRILFPPAYLEENAKTLQRELDGFNARIGAMVQAAKSFTEVSELCDFLAKAGLEVEAPAVVTDSSGATVAWQIRARR